MNRLASSTIAFALMLPPAFLTFVLSLENTAFADAKLTGIVRDSESGETLPARVYVQSDGGKYYFVEVSSPQGSAVVYNKARESSIEQHTTISAHPFQVTLPAGEYTVTAVRGKEYLETSQRVTIADFDVRIELPTRRWTNMASRGWYSGDTHVHRKLEELPNIVMAEDLNVALPLTHWVTDSRQTPKEVAEQRGVQVSPRLIQVDSTHFIWPVNTEYEIFTVEGKRHTLGALFVLNHQSPLTKPAPPIGPIIEQAKAQPRTILLDLDKHNWPWSMMVAEVGKVDLYELTNNHIWRTNFRFSDWYPEYVGKHMGIELGPNGFTERQWIDFGLQNYHTLLNCGQRIRPSGGTASGVHPVPLGFGRVYAEVGGEFRYDKWIEALGKGRSFVTTGPMLTATLNGQPFGSDLQAKGGLSVDIKGTANDQHPIHGVEVIINGKVVKTIPAGNIRTARGGIENPFRATVEVAESSWIALRAFSKRDDGRPRFAHSSPVFMTINEEPIRPSRAEVQYLLDRIQNEIQRHRGVLKDDAMSEYESAAKYFQSLLKIAR